jgi:hypothetical protein
LQADPAATPITKPISPARLELMPIDQSKREVVLPGQMPLFTDENAFEVNSPEVPAGGKHSHYVVYVDESGDHSLASVDPDYPVFVLALCIFNKRHYAERIIPAIEKLKFNYFGHDSVILHENEIRKQKGDFAFLSHLPTRNEFMGRMSAIMAASNFILIACVVDKARLKGTTGATSNPYHIALGMSLEALRAFLAEKGQDHPANARGGGVQRKEGGRRVGTGVSPHLRRRESLQSRLAIRSRVR